MKPFSLLIKPASADCNLRCEYCFYLDHAGFYPKTRIHRMSDEVLERMISSFMSVPMPQYAFGWQGGEPTMMGLDFFRRAVQLQQKHGSRGTVVANGLQTNATLITDEFAQFLAQYHFLLGVSLDGPAGVHDAHRHYINGRGSHADVLRGIENLKRHNVEFNILVLVNEANVGKAREVYQYLCDNGFYFHQYIPCVEFDEKGEKLPFAITGEQWGDFLCELYDTWIAADTRQVSIRLFDSVLNYLVDGTHVTCNMGRNCRQYFVVEHNGDIFPCDFFVEKDLQLGNVMDTSWEQAADSDIYKRFGRRKAMWNEACEQCRHLALCAGDCPKHRYYAADNPRDISWLCKGWKKFYDHTTEGFEGLAGEIKQERSRGGAPSPAPAPIPASFEGVGRNDPCPCGSGLKYKKCCMKK